MAISLRVPVAFAMYAFSSSVYGVFLGELVSPGDGVRDLCQWVTWNDLLLRVRSITRCVFHSVYTLIFHTPTDLLLHAGTEDLLLLVDVYYLVWLAGGKPWFSMLVKTTSRQINLHVSCP